MESLEEELGGGAAEEFFGLADDGDAGANEVGGLEVVEADESDR